MNSVQVPLSEVDDADGKYVISRRGLHSSWQEVPDVCGADGFMPWLPSCSSVIGFIIFQQLRGLQLSGLTNSSSL
jgi:hypothetical protein